MVIVIVETDAGLITLRMVGVVEVEAGDMAEIVRTAEIGRIAEVEIDPTAEAEIGLIADQDPTPGIDTAAEEEVVAGEATLVLVRTHAVDREIGVVEVVRKEVILVVPRGRVAGAGIRTGVERKRRKRTRKEKKIKSVEIDRTLGAEVVAKAEVEADRDLDPPSRTEKRRNWSLMIMNLRMTM